MPWNHSAWQQGNPQKLQSLIKQEMSLNYSTGHHGEDSTLQPYLVMEIGLYDNEKKHFDKPNFDS